jgi:hypothetical protein
MGINTESAIESSGPHRPGTGPAVRQGACWGSVAALEVMIQLGCRLPRLRVYPGRLSPGQRLLHGSGWARLLRDGSDLRRAPAAGVAGTRAVRRL